MVKNDYSSMSFHSWQHSYRKYIEILRYILCFFKANLGVKNTIKEEEGVRYTLFSFSTATCIKRRVSRMIDERITKDKCDWIFREYEVELLNKIIWTNYFNHILCYLDFFFISEKSSIVDYLTQVMFWILIFICDMFINVIFVALHFI